jgi:hypothetical protein
LNSPLASFKHQPATVAPPPANCSRQVMPEEQFPTFARPSQLLRWGSKSRLSGMTAHGAKRTSTRAYRPRPRRTSPRDSASMTCPRSESRHSVRADRSATILQGLMNAPAGSSTPAFSIAASKSAPCRWSQTAARGEPSPPITIRSDMRGPELVLGLLITLVLPEDCGAAVPHRPDVNLRRRPASSSALAAFCA